MAGTILTPLAGIIGGAKFFAERGRQKNYAKIFADPSTASPAPLPVADPERQAMLVRIAQVERDAADARAAWRNSDAEKKLAEAVAEMERMRTALVRARAVRDELKKMNGELRLENARLLLELESASAPELLPDEDISGRIPTLRPTKPVSKDPS